MVSRRSWPGTACWVLQVAHLAAVAVDNHVAGAVLAAQQLVVGLLDAGLAHHVARLVGRIARLIQVFFAHLAHVTDEVGGKAVAGIQPPLFVDGLQLGQLVAMSLDERLLVGGYVQLDGEGLVAGRGAIAAQHGAQLLQIEVEALGDQGQIGVHVAALLANQKAGDRRVVVHHQPALAIEEFAAGGEHGLLADAVLLGLEPEVLRVQDLKPPQAGSQRQHHDQNAVLRHSQLEAGELLFAVDPAGIHLSKP